MADVVDKVRMHVDIAKRLSDLRKLYIPVDIAKAAHLQHYEVRMVKAQNDTQLLVCIQDWLHALRPMGF